MRYVIVEDELYSMRHLAEHIGALRPEWELEGGFTSAAQASRYFSSGGRPDLCFFDVELEDGLCFEIFRNMPPDVPVIFTTAFDSYSIQAFKVNAIGYVLKPLDRTELRMALEKFENMTVQSRTNELERLKRSILEDLQAMNAPSNDKRLLVTVGNGYGYVKFDEIAWLVSEEKYVFVITTDGRRLLTTVRTLNEAEELLDGRRFHRVSRNIICSIESVAETHKYFKSRLKVMLEAGRERLEVTVTSSRRTEFLQWLGAGLT